MNGYGRMAGLAVLASWLLAGCGGSGYKPPEGVIVKGTVLKGGKALEVPRRDVGLGNVIVKLVPVAGSPGQPESSFADDKGAFVMRGPGDGIRPGKYRLAVLQQNQGPGSDLLRGAFSEAKSPIEVDVPANRVGSTHDLGTIDLDQPKK
jgi:hypothetical protein